jgi:hypothetical protein
MAVLLEAICGMITSMVAGDHIHHIDQPLHSLMGHLGEETDKSKETPIW